jgi:hypothetical protein
MDRQPFGSRLRPSPRHESTPADLRYAVRELRRRPGFAVTAVLSLVLGIGATSAVFSVIYGVLINPLHKRPCETGI